MVGTSRSSARLVVAFALTAVGTSLGRPAPAVAASPDAVLDEMVEINRKAIDELRVGKNEAARDNLTRAIGLGKKAGLGGHQMMARTYLHLAAVYLTGFDDRERAMRNLVTAVKIRPNIQITPQLLTPSLQEAFETARVQVLGRAAETPQPAEPPPSSPPVSPPISSAALPPASSPALSSTPSPAWPPVAAHQAAASPPAAAANAGALDFSAPLTPFGGPATESISAEAGPSRQRAAHLWVGLGVGSALGWHRRQDLDTQSDYYIPAGMATAALVHLAPEIGYRVDERTAFSLQSRHQLVPVTGSDSGGRPRTAHAIFARAHRRLHAFGDRVDLWGTAALGGGSAIRLYVPERPSAGLQASDSVAVGPLAFGPGVSLLYHAAPRVAIAAEVRSLVTVWRTAVLADFGLGAIFGF
jgi:hypothetical protein